MIQRIYIDTSIVGGFFDKEFEKETQALFQRLTNIVNLSRIKGYNSVNMKMGYMVLEIRNPKELIEYGNE